MPTRRPAHSSLDRAIPPLPDVVLEPIVKLALAEDLGAAGDVTTDALIDPEAQGRWAVVARRAGVIAGLDAAMLAAWLIDTDLVAIAAGDGARRAATPCCKSPGAPLDDGRRTMLGSSAAFRASPRSRANMSTVEAWAPSSPARKTTPGMRWKKRAVALGSHRYGLNDVLIRITTSPPPAASCCRRAHKAGICAIEISGYARSSSS